MRSAPRCGAVLPTAAPAGICPQCDLQGALDLLAAPPPAPAGPMAADESAPAEESGWSGRRFGDYEHEHAILHRDLKPSNVIIDAEDHQPPNAFRFSPDGSQLAVGLRNGRLLSWDLRGPPDPTGLL